MKKHTHTSAEESKMEPEGKKLTRKAAIKKAGIITLSAGSMLVVLSQKKALAYSGLDGSPRSPGKW